MIGFGGLRMPHLGRLVPGHAKARVLPAFADAGRCS